jgi:hypothetical protein
MHSRMNDCVGLGSTGYPFVFAMKVVEGRSMFRTDSAAHLLRTPSVVGRGGVRSRADRYEQLNAIEYQNQTYSR